MGTRDEAERFDERYRVTGGDLFLELEREVLDSDYQANGYTTRAQADELGRRLGLGPTSLLVDVGSGCGWPGLYLAVAHGCSVVTVDPSASGAAASRERLIRDGMADRGMALVGRGERLPLRPGSVDAVVHVDVTC